MCHDQLQEEDLHIKLRSACVCFKCIIACK